MTDKEKYAKLIQRYWDAETTIDEERDLARYVSRVNAPEFDELRGVLGYLSIGRDKRNRKVKQRRMIHLAVAAGVVFFAIIGLNRNRETSIADDYLFGILYGEEITDNQQIMDSIEATLTDFFSDDKKAGQ